MRPKDTCRDRLPASPSPGRGKIHSGVQSLTGRRGGMEVRFVQPCGISLTSVQFVGVGEVSAAEAVIVVASVARFRAVVRLAEFVQAGGISLAGPVG